MGLLEFAEGFNGLFTPQDTELTYDTLLELNEKVKSGQIVLQDLHNHTAVSPCSNRSLDDLINFAKEHGIAQIAVTDHNIIDQRIWDYKERAKDMGIDLVVGIEVKAGMYGAKYGEFNILDINSRREAEEIMSFKKGKYFDYDGLVEFLDQNGLKRGPHDRQRVILNHPFSSQIFSGWKKVAGLFGYGTQEGFNFADYILDHWDKTEIKDRIRADKNSYIAFRSYEASNPDNKNPIRSFLHHKSGKKTRKRLLKELEINSFVSNYITLPSTENDFAKEAYSKHIDIIKKFLQAYTHVELNTNTYRKSDNAKSISFAQNFGKDIIAGADRHFKFSKPKSINLYDKETGKTYAFTTGIYQKHNFRSSWRQRLLSGIYKPLRQKIFKTL